jgi:hypothetical protein
LYCRKKDWVLRKFKEHTLGDTMKAIAFLLLLAASAFGQEAAPKSPWELLSTNHDKNKDGKVTEAEYGRGEERFKRLDQNGDGVLTAADFEGVGGGPRRGQRPAGRRAAGGPQRGKGLDVGVLAPDFTLPTKADPKKKETLSSYRKNKPVALIFGSYT